MACLVATNIDGVITGFVTVSISTATGIGLISNLAVEPSLHSKGVGRRLLEAAVELMQQRELAVGKIETLSTNSVGRWLYPAVGASSLAQRRAHVCRSLC